MVTTRAARADDEAFVLALTERLAAFAVPGWRTAAQVTHVETLATEAKAGGMGVGRMLMTAVEGWARVRGSVFVTLNVFDTNVRARGFCTRLGYRPETVHYIKPL